MKSNLLAALVIVLLVLICVAGFALLEDRQQAECAKRHASAVQVSNARYICVDSEGRIV